MPNQDISMDYNRKHDLTTEEIKQSPVFKNLNDQEIEEVKMTLIKMCQILMESVDDKHD